MTVIVAADYGREVLLLSDTRVSVPNGPPSQDLLQKLVILNFGGRAAVLGFSGVVAECKRVLEAVRLRAKHYRSSGSLKRDLADWMDEVIENKPSHARRDAVFMLCDFDPSEHCHVHIYELPKQGRVKVHSYAPPDVLDLPRMTVIGSGRKFGSMLFSDVMRFSKSSKGYVSYEAYSNVRSAMTLIAVSCHFRDLDLTDIGGPFVHCVVRAEEVIGPHPFDPGKPDMGWKTEGYNKILFSSSCKSRYVLYSIFSYADAAFYGCANACAAPFD